MIAAAMTRGDVVIQGCVPEHMHALAVKMRQAGADVSDAILDPAALELAELKKAVTRRYLPQSAATLGDALAEHALWLDSQGQKGTRALLAKADLSDRAMAGARLVMALLPGDRLHRANLRRALLAMCDLTSADLRNAILSEADMRGATLRRACFNGANLARAKLGPLIDVGVHHADFPCNCEQARFVGANLAGVNLRRANLTGADFSRADLTGAQLQEARLDGCNFTGAIVKDANFDGASLTRVKGLPVKR